MGLNFHTRPYLIYDYESIEFHDSRNSFTILVEIFYNEIFPVRYKFVN